MDIREISREKWAHFLDKFSKDHAGKSVTLEAYGPGTNPHEEARSLPLVGVTYEPHADGSIEIQLGTEASNHLSHTVAQPTHVWVKPDESGDILEIRADDGVTVLLRFPAGSRIG